MNNFWLATQMMIRGREPATDFFFNYNTVGLVISVFTAYGTGVLAKSISSSDVKMQRCKYAMQRAIMQRSFSEALFYSAHASVKKPPPPGAAK
jgi:hypothetical protein